MKHLLLFLFLPFLLAVPTQDAKAQQTLTCKSRHHDYNYCRANTNNQVRLERRLSRASCVQGRSWGYDRNGIWVDDGCEARFSYGSRRQESRRDRDDDDNGNAAAAVAVGAGLAVLLGAAAIASANDDDHKRSNHHSSTSRPPSWMVGTFEGYINYGDTRVTLIVHSDGTIDRYADGQHTRATYRNGRVYVQDRVADVERVSRGFRLNDNEYRRVR